ncbi:HalOD1 output domain-containing protein [Salinilacihabitans rarus]|uniref:HalOD1 output domain-containing protein n=1 Tax=Salinilacihabitans rarus TaxID=2961596 RepID=UPI0020C8AF84|nr:HalOD1 output domain-containing protein [Salinilacihabitans rarus]
MRPHPAPAPHGPPASPPPVYRTYHDPDGPATLSTTVVHALADCMGVDVTDGRISLYDAVDPDALDALFRPRHDGSPRTGGHLVVFVHDHRVTVYGDGEIVIEPPAPAARR